MWWCEVERLVRRGSQPLTGGSRSPGAGEGVPGERAAGGLGARSAQRRAREALAVVSEDAGQHLLAEFGEDRLLRREVGLPGRGVPDLDPGVRADDRALATQACVFA